MSAQFESVWQPQEGLQEALVTCPIGDIFAGGARGGGKTDGVIGRIIYRAGWYGAHYNAAIFRQEMPQADDLIDRFHGIAHPFGELNKTNRIFVFRNGARVRFRPLENVRDAQKYQGQNLTDAVIEEAGNYPSPAPIDRLFGALRSASGIPTSIVLTGNPGGPGQPWLRERYVSPAPDGMVPLVTTIPALEGMHGELKHTRIYIPGKVTDNRLLLENDPSYIARLYRVGDKKLVDAWLLGDWDAVEGAFFEDWSEARHVVEPFEIPAEWLTFRSIDWGFAAPFSVGWHAVASEDYEIGERTIPRGSLVRFREWYGCVKGQPNTGIRMNADEVAAGILERDAGRVPMYTVLDPAAWGTQSGPSIAETMFRCGVPCRKADNRRVAGQGHLGGWDQVRQRLRGDPESGRPRLYIFKTCADSRRLVPQMQHDRDKPEDLDTDMEDHIPDELRYACMSRPWVREVKKPIDPMAPTWDQVLEEHDRRKAEGR